MSKIKGKFDSIKIYELKKSQFDVYFLKSRTELRTGFDISSLKSLFFSS